MAEGKPTTIRLPIELSDALDRQARAETRSRAQQIARYVRDGLRRDGVDVPDHELVSRGVSAG